MERVFTIALTKEEWELLRDGVADVACWHYGFSAANKDHEPPPQLKAMLDLMGSLKRRAQCT